MQNTALVPYADLPQQHRDRQVLTSTVDVFGTAHWLLAEHAPQPRGDVRPFDALVVSVDPGGTVERTELNAVRVGWPHLDRMPDGGKERDRLVHGEITATSVESTGVGLLTLPDGSSPRRRRVVARGSRIYVQAEPFTTWGVYDLDS
ncbi:hypothetical protein ACWC6I_10165 [Streptomyces sp. NPDC001414]